MLHKWRMGVMQVLVINMKPHAQVEVCFFFARENMGATFCPFSQI